MTSPDKQVVIYPELCDLCGTCVGVCPENVIRMSAYELSIDHEDCTRCHKCIWVCPVRALEMKEVVQSTELRTI